MEYDINNLTIDQSFKELDRIIALMQSEDISLEDAFSLYKEGLTVVEGCSGKIEKIQCAIRKLNTAEE
ncbi:MAG: exodeoxyribonuclease VII small subunit [Parasporobacterium sp.]|nr:exodeoxyribonuclease VII small subunit [Parasporobacterium sp.]